MNLRNLLKNFSPNYRRIQNRISQISDPDAMDSRWQWKDDTISKLHLAQYGWNGQRCGTESEIWTPDYTQNKQLYRGIILPSEPILQGCPIDLLNDAKESFGLTIDIADEYVLLTKLRYGLRSNLENNEHRDASHTLLLALPFDPEYKDTPKEFAHNIEALKMIRDYWWDKD